jgi:hypothetical protein
MASKLFKGKIDVTKIIKDKLFKGEKGTYLDVDIWLNDEPDKYGNHISIAQSSAQGEAKNYIGNAKEWVKKESDIQNPAPVSNDGKLPF